MDVDSIGVLGPKDISYNEIAEAMSEVFGKMIGYAMISPETLKRNVLKYGGSAAGAQSLADIYSSMERGTFNRVNRTIETSSPTELSFWLEENAAMF